MMNVSSRLRPTHLLPAIAIVVAACAGGNARPSPSFEVSPTSIPSASISPGDPDTAALRLEPFAEGLASPTFVTHAGDGSGLLYVVEQEGRIRTVDPNGTVGAAPFLDIADRIVAGGEQGLLGLAFHPDYPDDGRFFVMYTSAEDGANTISEYRATDGVAAADSERILLAIPDFAVNHNGGMVAFGPDGYLYAGTGDGGGGGDP
nr:PQQ-dependent sugar dehydrogenase [Chloroflexota bacterium]